MAPPKRALHEPVTGAAIADDARGAALARDPPDASTRWGRDGDILCYWCLRRTRQVFAAPDDASGASWLWRFCSWSCAARYAHHTAAAPDDAAAALELVAAAAGAPVVPTAVAMHHYAHQDATAAAAPSAAAAAAARLMAAGSAMAPRPER